jgi:hypothetical protein
MKYLNVGDLVEVQIPEKIMTDNPMLLKYQGMRMRITRRQPVGCALIPYYELEDAVSKLGVPYSFSREMIREV